MGISVCMISRDDQPFLPRSVPAARACGDQLIFVDTGSSDDTLNYMKSHADILVRIKPRVLVEKGFAYARNLAASFADHEWIYQLDADEMLSAEQRPELRKITQTTDAVAISFNVLTFADSNRNFDDWDGIANSCGHDDGRHIRLYRNTPRVRWEGYIHEELYENGVVPCFQTALKTDLKHLHFTKYRRWGARDVKELRFSYMLKMAYEHKDTYGKYMSQWWFDHWYPNNLPTINARAAEYLQKRDHIDPV